MPQQRLASVLDALHALGPAPGGAAAAGDAAAVPGDTPARYRLLFSAMTEGFALLEAVQDAAGPAEDSRFLDVNPAFCRMTGLPAEQVVGRRVSEVLPGAQPSWARTCAEVARTGSPVQVEDGAVAPGRQHHVFAFSPVPGQAAVLFLDVTAQRLLEAERERSRSSLEKLVATTTAVVRETSLEGMLQALADAARELTGARVAACGHIPAQGNLHLRAASRAEGVGSCAPGTVFDVLSGGGFADVLEGRDLLRLTDAELRAHPRWHGAPAEPVPLRGLLGVRLGEPGGSVDGLVLVSDREQGEFTAEDASLLRQLGSVASLALRHIESRLRLEEADQRKNHFLAVLSHELRNPLAPVRSSVYLLQRAPPGTEAAQRAVDVIDRQVTQMTRLVDDLLDVTRISHGRTQLHREHVDLASVVRRAAEDLRPVFAAAQVELSVQVPGGRAVVDGDRTRLAQVVGNLLSNAAKFTPPGGRASVSLERQEDSVVVSVQDSGAGIPPDMMGRLFQPFSQADTTLDRRHGGLGLGLALVRDLVEMHGGHVGASSAGPGQGAEFLVRLPLLEGTAADPTTPPPPPRPTQVRRVLVIEDNPDFADSLREVLELDGHLVDVARTGTEGMDLARRTVPDLVLCDIGLPGMDGFQVARALRADPRTRALRVVALTGYASGEDATKAREAGFDLHLGKPPDLDAITRILAQVPPLR